MPLGDKVWIAVGTAMLLLLTIGFEIHDYEHPAPRELEPLRRALPRACVVGTAKAAGIFGFEFALVWWLLSG